MKKLWLSAMATACILAGSAAYAGDYGHRDHDHGRHRGWDRHEHRHYHDDHRHRSHYRGYREVYYRPVPVYYGPDRYYSRPVSYERRGYREYDNDIHGSITVGF